MKNLDDTTLKAEILGITKNIDNILKEIKNYDFSEQLTLEKDTN
jgi:hypothetical protein